MFICLLVCNARGQTHMSHLVVSVLPLTYICRPTENVNLNQYLTEFCGLRLQNGTITPGCQTVMSRKTKQNKKEVGDYSTFKRDRSHWPKLSVLLDKF